MPSCRNSTSPPPSPPWTPTTAQAALTVAAWQIQEAVELLEGIHRDLPPPPDLADRQEGRKPYDQATDILATIECVLEDDLRPARPHLPSDPRRHRWTSSSRRRRG